jgi:DNA-binding transcriptional ArsR family regulator
MTPPGPDVRNAREVRQLDEERPPVRSPRRQPDLSEALKALADPMRWDIVTRLARVTELPCAQLWQTLPISKPTISHHIKVLSDAGLLTVRKDGRQFYYSLRRDVVATVVREVQVALTAPLPRTRTPSPY